MRRSERHPIRFHIVYDDGKTYSVAHVDDISDDGMLMECAEPLPVGSVVTLEPVEPDEDELFEIKARVVRHLSPSELMARVPMSDGAHGLTGMGVEFIDGDAAAIHKMIERMERR